MDYNTRAVWGPTIIPNTMTVKISLKLRPFQFFKLSYLYFSASKPSCVSSKKHIVSSEKLIFLLGLFSKFSWLSGTAIVSNLPVEIFLGLKHGKNTNKTETRSYREKLHLLWLFSFYTASKIAFKSWFIIHIMNNHTFNLF